MVKKNIIEWDEEEDLERYPDYKYTVGTFRDQRVRHWRVRIGGQEYRVD